MQQAALHSELVKEALRIGAIYAKNRKAAEFQATDSAKLKIEYLYRLLVHDGLLQPLAKGTEVDREPALTHWRQISTTEI